MNSSAASESQNLFQSLSSLAPLDMLGLGLVLLLLLLGVWRGLWWQVIRLVGLVIAVGVARVLAPEASAWILENSSDLSPRVAHGVAWGAIFMLTLGAATILGMLGQRLLEAMKLGVLNRAGGALAGAVTGVVVHLAILVALSQLAPEEFVSKHIGGTYSSELLDRAGSQWRVALGAEAASEVDRLIGDGLKRSQPTGRKTTAPGDTQTAPKEPLPGEVEMRYTTETGGVR